MASRLCVADYQGCQGRYGEEADGGSSIKADLVDMTEVYSIVFQGKIVQRSMAIKAQMTDSVRFAMYMMVERTWSPRSW